MNRVTRGQFLRGDFAGRRLTIRPPWSVEEAQFQKSCSRCNDCVRACPEAVLKVGRGGYPEVMFDSASCTFCGACAESCRSAAILRDEHASPWALKARISDECIALRGVECRSCGDFCDARAIRFKLRAGVVANPLINVAACTGCGACVAPCPVKAVRVLEPEQQAVAV